MSSSFHFKLISNACLLYTSIEPMINEGRPDVEWLGDDWTVVTEDSSLSAHYENTILITDGEPEILTLTDKELESM